MPLSFPANFLWGAATSGYQVEGGTEADGKGRSIWDEFVGLPGKVLHGDTGRRACNAYDPEQIEGDLDLMVRLGLKAYGFSAQWPRIQPAGRGAVNTRGLDYYRRLVDGLCRRDILPVLTLYHWELPLALQELGGWLERDTVARFVDYAGLLYDALADRVPFWITQNEPHTSAWLGYGSGRHAPGLARGAGGALRAAHHLLLAHGQAVRTLRVGAGGGGKTQIGAVLNVIPFRPASPDREADRAVAWRVDGEQNRLFFDALFHGEYPADVVELHRAATDGFAFVRPGDLDVIHTPGDFLGVNYYAPAGMGAGADGSPRQQALPGSTTAMGWAIDPAGLQEALVRVRNEYTGNLPLMVTENGASFRDYLDPEGECRDPERVDFLRTHLREAHRAIADGVPLRGYFVWSLLDNFEWESGYRERFGLLYVDYATQRRVPKTSFGWYRDVIGRNGLADGEG